MTRYDSVVDNNL